MLTIRQKAAKEIDVKKRIIRTTCVKIKLRCYRNHFLERVLSISLTNDPIPYVVCCPSYRPTNLVNPTHSTVCMLAQLSRRPCWHGNNRTKSKTPKQGYSATISRVLFV